LVDLLITIAGLKHSSMPAPARVNATMFDADGLALLRRNGSRIG
jgi:hypothetical protein